MATNRAALLDRIEEMDSAYRDAIVDVALTMVCASPVPEKPTTASGLWSAFSRRKAPTTIPRQRGR